MQKNLINQQNLLTKYHEEREQKLFGFAFSTHVSPSWSCIFRSSIFNFQRTHENIELSYRNSHICPHF